MYGEIAAQKFDFQVVRHFQFISNTVVWGGQLYILAIHHSKYQKL